MNNGDEAEVMGILANSGRLQWKLEFLWGVGGDVTVKNDHKLRQIKEQGQKHRYALQRS